MGSPGDVLFLGRACARALAAQRPHQVLRTLLPVRAIALVVAVAVSVPSVAHAYCRRSNCGGAAGTVCVPARADDCGAPVHWRTEPVPYQITRYPITRS